MNEIIWSSDIGDDYYISAEKLSDATAQLVLKKISTDSIILNQTIEISGGVSTMNIINWMNLAKSAIDNI